MKPRARARIAPNGAGATQSGRGAGGWTLVIEPTAPLRSDPLMGWTASDDARAQVRMTFPTREEAVRYAERRGLDYEAEPEPAPEPQGRLYAENFDAKQTRPWTH